MICLSLMFAFFGSEKVKLDGMSKSIYDYKIDLIDGELISMQSYLGKKIIIVNVASKCGYTPQYKELQELYEKYQDKVEIIGFPANDFLWQEPAKNAEIKKFCSINYGVNFSLVEKTVVKKNKHQHPIFTWLTHKDLNGWNDAAPGWNFYKYLIDEDGKLVKSFSSKIKPFDNQIVQFLED